MFTAADVIVAAREIMPEGTEDVHPEWTLLRALTRYARRLTNLVSQRDRYLISAEITISLPLADFAVGADLSGDPFLRLNGGIATTPAGDGETFNIVPPTHRYRNDGWPGGFILQNTLYLLGRAADWTKYSSITLYTVPVVAIISADTDPVDLPDSALEPCAWDLALFMARRIPLDAKERVRIGDTQAEVEAVFLDEIQERTHVTKTKVREIF